MLSYWCVVSQLDVTKPIKRVGIIPYTLIGKKILLCLGQDRVHKEFTDFGGGYSSRRDIHPAHCAVRELREESLEVFTLKVDEILNDNCIVCDGNIIVFHRIDYSVAKNIAEDFHQKLLSHSTDEVECDDIQWIGLAELHSYIDHERIYKKVADILLDCMGDIVMKIKKS